MQVLSRNLMMVRSRLRPLVVAGGAKCGPAGCGRNSMADSPQDLCARLATPVRFVQHLILQSSDLIFGQPSSLVTLRSPGKRQ